MPESRATQVLQYLVVEGYAKTSQIHKQVLTNISIQTVRRELKAMREEHKTISYKELPRASGKRGEGERVYFINEKGLKALGKSNAQIREHEKRLKRISAYKMRHYLLCRDVEKKLASTISDARIHVVCHNEFNDEKHLNINYVKLHSDLHFILSINNTQVLILRVEVDRGTESYSVLKDKLRKYQSYCLKENLLKFETTYPVYVLFVMKKSRVQHFIDQVKDYHFLLLASYEDIDDFPQQKTLANSTGQTFHLPAFVYKRYPLILLHSALQSFFASFTQYELIVETRYKTPRMEGVSFEENGKRTFLYSDGHLYLYLYTSEQFNRQEILFAMILHLHTCDTPFEKILQSYEHFFSQKPLLQQVTSSKRGGCIFVVKNDEVAQRVLNAIEGYSFKERVLILTEEALRSPHFISEKVWMLHNRQYRYFFPKE